MRTDTDLIARCSDILGQEIALLERLATAQEVVRKAVFAREWSNLETMLGQLSAYGRDFAALEAKRSRFFAELDPNGEKRESIRFYTMVAHLPNEQRRELTDLYRKLKLDTIRVRLANDALTSYLADARSVLSGFMDAAFPDRKGRIYSRRGTTVHAEMRSIVLNHSL